MWQIPTGVSIKEEQRFGSRVRDHVATLASNLASYHLKEDEAKDTEKALEELLIYSESIIHNMQYEEDSY